MKSYSFSFCPWIPNSTTTEVCLLNMLTRHLIRLLSHFKPRKLLFDTHCAIKKQTTQCFEGVKTKNSFKQCRFSRREVKHIRNEGIECHCPTYDQIFRPQFPQFEKGRFALSDCPYKSFYLSRTNLPLSQLLHILILQVKISNDSHNYIVI